MRFKLSISFFWFADLILRVQNILMDKMGFPKLIDFGWTIPLLPGATYIESEETPLNLEMARWMAPEILNFRQYSEKSDVWAWACYCIELLSGFMPYSSNSDTNAVIRGVQGHKLSPMADLSRYATKPLPNWFSALLWKTLVGDAQNRPSFSEIIAIFKKEAPSECFRVEQTLPRPQGMQQYLRISPPYTLDESTSALTQLSTFDGHNVLLIKNYEKKWLDSLRVAEIATRLPPHPNVLRTFAASVATDNVSIVIERTDYGTLEQLIEQLPRTSQGTPQISQTLLHRLALGIARGMEHIAFNRVVHRDLCAANIYIDANAEAKARRSNFSF